MEPLLSTWKKTPTWVKAAVAVGGLLAVREVYARLKEKSVKDEVVLITGAGNGIGRLLALLFAKHGASLVLCDRDEVAVKSVGTEVSHLGARVRVWKLDVTNRTAIADFAREVGRVDILINNAGVVSGKKLLDASDGEIIRTFDVNILAHFWMVRAFLPGMLERNHGHVVTIASASGYIGVPGLVDYASSKWAAVGFDESLRMELRRLGKTGVKTTCVNPFYINTGMFQGVSTRFPFLLPILEPDDVTQRIFTAIRRDSPVLCMPWLVYTIPLMRGLVPTWFMDFAAEVLGVSHSMDDFVGRGPAALGAPVLPAITGGSASSAAAGGGGGGGGGAGGSASGSGSGASTASAAAATEDGSK